MNAVKKSNFAELVQYMTDGQGKEERIGDVSVTNCQSDRVDAAILEVINTQGKNTRATSDKTFHLLVSFPPGEEPDGAVLKAIERKLCDGIGFGSHQRVSALHTDTDSLHLHIAINKIHPTRYTIYEPYNVYHTLGFFCEKLEREYGLTLVNHTSKNTLSEDHATDMEHHAGIESLLGWIKRECFNQIQAAQSWEALHRTMQVNGLSLHERGNGLVITTLDGTTVKASSIGRDFSKTKLEAKFGTFEPSTEHGSDRPAKKYEQKPLRSRVDTAELYTRYKHEMSAMNPLRAVELNRVIRRKSRLIEDAKRSGRLKRATLKLIKGHRTTKRILYAQISHTLKDEISRINQSYLNGRQAIYRQYTRLAWADWLKQQAIGGDQEALAALRGRLVMMGLKGDTVGGESRQATEGLQAEQDNITKKGTVFYRVGKTIIRDDGERLKVGRGVTQANLQTVLVMAMERYGQHIKINGSADFKEQVVQAAASANLPITFDDTEFERRHQAILQSNTTQEHSHEQKPTSGNRGGFDRGGNGGTRPAPARTLPKRFPSFNKPDLGKIGSRPPPESQNRLRGLSELGVVHLAQRGEVLLPGDVPGHLVQQGAQPDNRMRRDAVGAGAIAAGQAAADKYIAEREAKRLLLYDIPKHTRYHGSAEVSFFGGLRQVDGQALALLKDSDQIMVLPIDGATERRLKRIAVGDCVTVTPNGTIKTKGRSR
jgi:Relaxase/Mobilisation nuclease domain/Large polyvalent protein-associated domain 7